MYLKSMVIAQAVITEGVGARRRTWVELRRGVKTANGQRGEDDAEVDSSRKKTMRNRYRYEWEETVNSIADR